MKERLTPAWRNAGSRKIYSDVLGRTVKTEILNWQGGSVYSATVNTYNARDQVTQSQAICRRRRQRHLSGHNLTYDGYGRLKTKHVPEQAAAQTPFGTTTRMTLS